MIRIVIPEATPSLNVWQRKHWAAKKRDRQRWAHMLLAEIMRLGGKQAVTASGKRRLTIERHGRRVLDDDNRVGGCKGLIDELRAFGLLVDDDPRHLELVAVDLGVAKGQSPHSVLVLEDVLF